MQIIQPQLKRFAQILTRNDVRIASSRLPNGEYVAAFVDKKLGSEFTASIANKISENHLERLYATGEGKNPREAALAFIQKLPEKGTIEFHNLNDWENLIPAKSIDYRI